jgi:hypothetical protein
MCECNCSPGPLGKIRAPTGWYAIEFHPGCDNGCGTEMGLAVTHFPKMDEDAKDALRGVKELRWFDSPPYSTLRTWATPVLDTAILHAKFAAQQDSEDDDLGAAPSFALEEFIESGGLRDTFFATIAAEESKARKRRRRPRPSSPEEPTP